MTSWAIFHLSNPLNFTIIPVAFVYAFVLELACTLAVAESDAKMSLKVFTVLRDLGSFTMLHVIHPVPIILVFVLLLIILCRVRLNCFIFAVSRGLTIDEVATVWVTILKSDAAVSMRPATAACFLAIQSFTFIVNDRWTPQVIRWVQIMTVAVRVNATASACQLLETSWHLMNGAPYFVRRNRQLGRKRIPIAASDIFHELAVGVRAEGNFPFIVTLAAIIKLSISPAFLLCTIGNEWRSTMELIELPINTLDYIWAHESSFNFFRNPRLLLL